MRRILLAILVLVLTLGVAPDITVRAADATPQSASPPSAPPAGVIFNDPTGSRARQYAIVTQVIRGIDASPPGTRITMAQYLYDLPTVTEALLRAHDRGVQVQVLVDSRARSVALTQLRTSIGTNKQRSSFVASCRQACMASAVSIMHAKFVLFSRTG